MKTKKNILMIATIAISFFAIVNGCSSSRELIADKSGATLWAENCMRCHNSPSPTDYNDAQWDIIGNHMKVRANITDEEEQKIIEFLKTAN